jgi:hypothetical protein
LELGKETGPQIFIKGRRLSASGRSLLDLAFAQWIRFEIAFPRPVVDSEMVTQSHTDRTKHRTNPKTSHSPATSSKASLGRSHQQPNTQTVFYLDDFEVRSK